MTHKLRFLLRWLFAAVIVLLLILALRRFDGESVLYSLRQIPLWLVAVLVGLQVVTQLLVNALWFQVARLAGVSVSFRQMFYVNCQGAVMDSITPGVKFGGEITRAVQISRVADCSGEQAATVVALQKLFSLSCLFFILLFATGFLLGEMPVLGHFRFLLYGTLVLLLSLFICALLMPRPLRNFLEKRKPSARAWIDRGRGFLLTLLEQLTAIRKDVKKMTMLLILSFIIWLLYPVKLLLITMPFTTDASAIYIGAAGYMAYMVAMLPIFPGGLGGFEATLSGLLTAFGFALNDAAVVTVLFRFITFWLVMLGSLGFLGIQAALKRPRRKGQ
ncbi:MAG: flippase-like domain-containing protein [Defluviitaleaceae bacterium]|nr:flippase-like domain-containing protein [Defluviitaleaceae bacterium]